MEAALAPPSTTAVPPSATATSPALFREIHKNAWLRRIPADDGIKILSGSQKKTSEKWWMVFCIHGDTDPYLEAYDDMTSACTHVPRWRAPLSRTHHVSGSIRHTGRGEYEFVVCTEDGTLRLVAPTREWMLDWVITLQNKLREMKILAPQENVYSKAPEQPKPRAPTRDPTSPLPPPPPGPTIRVPGTEPLRANASEVTITQNVSLNHVNVTAEVVVTEEPIAAQLIPVQGIEEQPSTSGQQTVQPVGDQEETSADLSEEFFNVRSHINQKSEGSPASISTWEQFVDSVSTFPEEVSQNISIPSTSKTAMISGMNVCLVESILDRRLNTDSDDEFFAEFDAACNRTEDQAAAVGRIEISDEQADENMNESKKKEIRLKYSQVNLKAKSEKPMAAIRNKILLNRTTSVPDTTGTDTYLENFTTEVVQDAPGSSNITIINVSEKPVGSYVNVETKKELATPRVSVGSGYGHIRHHSSEKKDTNVIFIKPPPASKPRRKSESGVSVEGFYESVFTIPEPHENQVVLKISEPEEVLPTPCSSGSRSVVEITSEPSNYELLSMTQNTPNTSQQESALEALINTSPIVDNARNVSRTNFKPGLFTRGLTELSIVTKFRNMGGAPPAPSSSTKKPLSVKLSLFNKFSDTKKDGAVLKSNRIEAVQKTESSLRRNWSEHNDRTAPLAIVRTPRAPILESSPPSSRSSMRRRSSSLSSTRTAEEETASPVCVTSGNSSGSTNNHDAMPPQRPLTLREQQVCRLKAEMRHAGGVRLRMRSRDCPGEAMALVDAYGAVWIAGWKQKSHPLLYNALHIGDRLAAVSGTPVTTSRQAKKLLRDTSSGVQFIELIIKRLPHARVFALRKDSDTQELGLIMDLATIAGIVPNTPATKGGVPSLGTLTEINGRPLNLLLKKDDTQVRDRLNAIGKDISLLIQPTEFVQLLRSGLKSIRSHKDYIIQ